MTGYKLKAIDYAALGFPCLIAFVLGAILVGWWYIIGPGRINWVSFCIVCFGIGAAGYMFAQSYEYRIAAPRRFLKEYGFDPRE